MRNVSLDEVPFCALVDTEAGSRLTAQFLLILITLTNVRFRGAMARL